MRPLMNLDPGNLPYGVRARSRTVQRSAQGSLEPQPTAASGPEAAVGLRLRSRSTAVITQVSPCVHILSYANSVDLMQ